MMRELKTKAVFYESQFSVGIDGRTYTEKSVPRLRLP